MLDMIAKYFYNIAFICSGYWNSPNIPLLLFPFFAIAKCRLGMNEESVCK